MRVAHLVFRSSHCHQMAQVAFRVEVALVVVELHPCHCATSMFVELLRCQFGKEGSCLFDCHERLLGIFQSQPLPCYARETLWPASSLPGLWREVSKLVVAFPVLRRVKALLWPFWPYSRQDACWTVQALPDLLVLP